MGYSTTLYSVDLASIQAAVGSNDAALIERALATDGPPEVDPTQGPRIKVTRDSRIFLNGRLVTLDEMRAAFQDPRWADTNVYWHHERGQKEGVYKERGSFVGVMYPALAGSRIAGIVSCDSEEELNSGGTDDEDELSERQAVLDLVAGTFTRSDASYGYGLEHLCRALGDRLGVISGKGRLKALKFDTPLAEPRSPIQMPEVDEFPYVSHLTAEEVRREVGRLELMDLAFPKSAAIEQDRRSLRQYMRSAADQGRGVVSFYY
jgi:hypothetical protein